MSSKVIENKGKVPTVEDKHIEMLFPFSEEDKKWEIWAYKMAEKIEKEYIGGVAPATISKRPQRKSANATVKS